MTRIINKSKSISKKIPDKFPVFDDWPEYKLEFMTKISSIIAENSEEIIDVYEEPEVEIEYNYVIATEELYEHNENGKCYVCNSRLNLEYNIELEEWVYPECILEDNKYVLHEICMIYK